MKVERWPDCVMIGRGRFWITLWYPLGLWSLSFHRGNCCIFGLELGPLEVQWSAA